MCISNEKLAAKHGRPTMYFDVQARVLNTITARINENYHDKGKILDFISSSENLYANSIHVHIIATEMQAAASHLFHSTKYFFTLNMGN